MFTHTRISLALALLLTATAFAATETVSPKIQKQIVLLEGHNLSLQCRLLLCRANAASMESSDFQKLGETKTVFLASESVLRTALNHLIVATESQQWASGMIGGKSMTEEETRAIDMAPINLAKAKTMIAKSKPQFEAAKLALETEIGRMAPLVAKAEATAKAAKPQ